ncbi:Glycosyltransferase sugar-binding region containing DXD motif [Ceratobasidium sp. AG-Ba]|nr:Glycosyltransferase sugar-binding region containing DXD motif [Ceratobasidium sp. AG-Ba]
MLSYEKTRRSPLPTSAVDEKHYLTSRPLAWTTLFFVPLPFVRRRLRVALPLPERIRGAASSSLGRYFIITILVFTSLLGYTLLRRLVHTDRDWSQPFTRPSTLVFEQSELKKIWEWEIASGHYPSTRSIPSVIELTKPPQNPSVPAARWINNELKAHGQEVTYSIGTGFPRRYPTIKRQGPNYPPRPPPGAIADLDIIMDRCEFSTNKYVRDCLEFMRVGTGLDGDDRVRRTNLDQYNYIFVEEETDNTASAPQKSLPVPSQKPKLVLNRQGRIEPPLVLSPARPPQMFNGTCDPDYPRIYHMYWAGPFTDKPYVALLSYLFTQNLGLDSSTPSAGCRPQFWMWINPAPTALMPKPTAEHDMFEDLKTSPWASPFLHPRFADVVKFKLWNTTQRLDSITELKDEWRTYKDELFNSGGYVYKVKAEVPANRTETSQGSDSEQKSKISTIVSDLARFVLCHKFGGIYLDADTILLRDWEELWGWRGAFAYRWSYHETYNTAVLRLNRDSAIGSFLFRTALHNKLDFHPMTVWKYMQDAYLEGLLLRLPDALFDSTWLHWEGYQRDRPPFPSFTDFKHFFKPPAVDGAAPSALGFRGFFSGAMSYHYHNCWKMPFDPARNYPELGPRFAIGEMRAKEMLREQSLGDEDDTNQEREKPDDEVDLSWSTVMKRTFEAYIRGERPNMYGEWIRW